MTGSDSAFEAPEKNSVPSLREPNSQPCLFSPPAPPAFNREPSPYRAPSFTTPRKPFDVDISSGPENLSSPGQADNEDTPEAARRATDFQGQDATTPAKKRNSLFNFYGRLAPSPRPGDTPRPKITDAIAGRGPKNRKRA